MALEGSPCQNTGQARWCHRRRWGSSPQTHRGSRSRGSEAEVSEAPPQSWAFSCEPRAEVRGQHSDEDPRKGRGFHHERGQNPGERGVSESRGSTATLLRPLPFGGKAKAGPAAWEAGTSLLCLPPGLEWLRGHPLRMASGKSSTLGASLMGIIVPADGTVSQQTGPCMKRPAQGLTPGSRFWIRSSH